MKIDAHQHFWKYDPTKHSWINEEMEILKKDFLPADLQKIYQENEIDGCVAVQADQTEAETFFLVELAKSYSFIKGVVGWIDLRSPQLKERLEFFAKEKIIKGFRHVVQDEQDPNFLLREDFIAGIALLDKFGYTYDILIFPHQLGAALELVRLFPTQKFVLDHIAKPYIKDGFFDGWANQIEALGKSPNVWCKLSGMVTEADWHRWKPQDFAPYLSHIFKVFGPQRLLYGSDWPVCLLGGEYSNIKQLIKHYIKDFSEAEQAKIWGENAIQFYGLN